MRLASLLVLLVPIAGCYSSHERVGVASDAPGSDARGIDAPSIDAPSIDTPRRDASACAAEVTVAVRVEPVTADPVFCEGTHIEGAMILGVDPEPAERGIRIHADFCPTRGADCRCDIVVSNVGADLADLVLIPLEGNTIDLAPSSLSIETMPTCECLGCPCSYALVLHAASGLLFGPAPDRGELVLSQGPATCPAPSACESAAWVLHGSSLGTEVDVPAGEDRDLGVLHLRSLRDVDIFAPCAACATCGSPQGAWVAWVRH